MIIGVLAAGLAAALLVLTHMYGERLILRSIGGRWFQNDGWRVFDDMVEFAASHHRTNVRPLFSLIALPATAALGAAFSLKAIQAIWSFNALCLSGWAAATFIACRFIGLDAYAAALVAALGGVSAASLFWFSVPETYPLSALAMQGCLLVAAAHLSRRVPDWLIAVASGTSAATALTNFMAGLALAAAYRSARQALRLSALALSIVVLAWAAQKLIFPRPASFPLKEVRGEFNYVLTESQGTRLDVLRTALVSSIVAPKIEEYEAGVEATGKQLTIQRSGFSSSGWAYRVLAAAWLAVLGAGVIVLVRTPALARFAKVVLWTAAGQVALHLMYGEETFLYALHFASLLVLIAGAALLRARNRWASVAATAFIVALAANNLTRLHEALSTKDLQNVDQRIASRANGLR